MSLLNTQRPNLWDDVTHQIEFLAGNCSFYLAIASPSGQGRWSFSIGETQLDCWVQCWAPQHKRDMDIPDDEGKGPPLLWEKAKRAGAVSPGEAKSQGNLINFFTERVTEHWNRFFQRECGVLRDYLNPDETQLWVTCCSWPYSGQEVGLDNFQRWLPTSAI